VTWWLPISQKENSRSRCDHLLWHKLPPLCAIPTRDPNQ
jgi:hypothetical protein